MLTRAALKMKSYQTQYITFQMCFVLFVLRMTNIWRSELTSYTPLAFWVTNAANKRTWLAVRTAALKILYILLNEKSLLIVEMLIEIHFAVGRMPLKVLKCIQ